MAIPPASRFDFLCLEEGSLSHPIRLYSSLSFQLIRFCLRIPRIPETLARPISFWLRLRLSKVRSRACGSSCITSPLWSFRYSPILEWLKGRHEYSLMRGLKVLLSPISESLWFSMANSSRRELGPVEFVRLKTSFKPTE